MNLHYEEQTKKIKIKYPLQWERLSLCLGPVYNTPDNMARRVHSESGREDLKLRGNKIFRFQLDIIIFPFWYYSQSLFK